MSAYMCVFMFEPERTGAPSLAELFKLSEPPHGIFSLSRHARSLARPACFFHLSPVFGYAVTTCKHACSFINAVAFVEWTGAISKSAGT